MGEAETPFKRSNILRTAMLLTVLLLFFRFQGASVHCAEEYVYYGVVPSRLYLYEPYQMGWRLDPETVKTAGLVSIVASKDSTHVKVYTLQDNQLVSEMVLNVMEKHLVSLPNGTIFKVVSDQLVTVMLLSGGVPEPGALDLLSWPVPFTFYPAVDGGYVGREFVFMVWNSVPYHIFALEPSEVTLTGEDGVERSLKLEANSHNPVQLEDFTVYSVESTGNIMIQSGVHGLRNILVRRSFSVPSAQGGFVGTRFYTKSTGGDSWMPVDFRISALEDTEVTIWDLEFKRIIEELEVMAGESAHVNPMAGGQGVIVVESDRPITFTNVPSGDVNPWWSYSAGVAYFGVKPNEETPFYLPINSTVEVYVFAHEDTVVKFDDIAMSVEADSYFLTTLHGFHKISSDKNVVVQVVQWPLIPAFQGLLNFAVTVPCIQAVSVRTSITLTPIAAAGEGLPLTYVLTCAIAVVATVVGFLALRRRSR